MNAKEIIQALDGPADVYQRQAVQAAMDQKDEVVPLLLEHLEQVLLKPETFCPDEYESSLPLYAVVLLNHHRVVEAHRLFVALASLPGEMPFDLFGDVIHHGFPEALWKTCGGDPADIIRLVENREANEYCRSSAIRALTYGVADGGLSRKDVVEFLRGLFTGDEASPDEPMVYNGAASALADLWPGEAMDVLRRAFDKGLVERFFVGIDYIEDSLEAGKEAQLTSLERRVRQELDQTPHEALESWACFNPYPARSKHDAGGSTAASPREKSHPSRRPKRAAKKKRKQARAARKKSRARQKRKR